jgi:hypothetical protein
MLAEEGDRQTNSNPEECPAMAKKAEINQSAEIKATVEQVGKDAKFTDVFEKLQSQHKGHKFTPNSCQQAFTLARKKLRFVNSGKKANLKKGGGGIVPLAKQRGTDRGNGILEAVRAFRMEP